MFNHWITLNKNYSRTPTLLLVTGIAVSGTVVLGFVHNAHAQDAPKGIPIGIFRAHPEVALATRWEDNVYKAASNVKSDFIAEIKPSIKLITHWSQNQFSLVYHATVDRYDTLTTENNTDQYVNLELKLVPSRRWEFGINYDLVAEHDERGSPESTTVPESLGPNRWLQHSLKGSGKYKFYRLGTELTLEHTDRSSLNNDQFTQDQSWNDSGLIFNWDLTGKTKLLTELGHKIIDYDIDPLMDSSESRLLVGVTWKATGKTEGTFKVGSVTKVFDNDVAKDATELTWDSGIVWTPQERTKFNFSSVRTFKEGNEQAEHSLSTTFKVDLKHNLRPSWSLLSSVDLGHSVYEPIRRENYLNGSLGFEYSLHRWLALTTEFSHKIKRSDIVTSEFDSNGLMFSLTGTL